MATQPIPHTPKHQQIELRPENKSLSNLPPPSPSDIPHFLKYAKDNLGIKDAAHYVNGLRDKHLGPDVLNKADIQELTGFDIGMPYGDALCLQAAAPSWWKSCTKQVREDYENGPAFIPILLPPHQQQQLQFVSKSNTLMVGKHHICHDLILQLL